MPNLARKSVLMSFSRDALVVSLATRFVRVAHAVTASRVVGPPPPHKTSWPALFRFSLPHSFFLKRTGAAHRTARLRRRPWQPRSASLSQPRVSSSSCFSSSWFPSSPQGLVQSDCFSQFLLQLREYKTKLNLLHCWVPSTSKILNCLSPS
jgi:hypothetical protein